MNVVDLRAIFRLAIMRSTMVIMDTMVLREFVKLLNF